MIDKQSIILGYFRQGKTKKQLARELQISVTTVKKYIQDYEQEMGLSGTDGSAKIPPRGVIESPGYNSSNRSKRKLNKAIQKIIDEDLAQNKIKREQGKHKQQLKKKDIHEALAEQGFDISYTSVCRYIRIVSQRSAEVFIRQRYEPGQAVEFDWGEVKARINGVGKNLMLAVFTSSYSNHRWAQLFYRQDMSSFLHSHACYFASTGGVPQQMVYDNMRVAVSKFTIRNVDKKPTEALLKMSCYYQFDYRFCNARKGNEKGHVERSVEYVRRKAFGRKDEFDSLSAANEHLWKVCSALNEKPLTGKTKAIQTVFEQELQHMKTAPTPYDTAQLCSLRVDKYSCIKVDTNWYSVPEGSVGGFVDVKIYPGLILIYSSENQCIATQVRQHTRFEYFLNIDHYLKTLRTKPGALLGSLTLFQADQHLKNIFSKDFENRPRQFIELLLFVREEEYEIAELQQAINKCIACCPQHPVSLDKLKILLKQNRAPDQVPIPQQATEEFSQSIIEHSQQQLRDIQALIS